MEWIADPSIWAGLITLIVIELVLGIDNLVFIAILAEKLPPKQRDRARVTGLLLAMLMRLLLLASISWLVTLTQPLFSFRSFTFSARDLIMLFGGFFLLFKATMELNERLEGKDSNNPTQRKGAKFWGVVAEGFGFVIPKGYLYAAIGFSVMIEALNQLAIFNRRRFLSANQTLRQRTTEAVMRLLSGQKEDAELDAETASMLVDHGNQQIFNPQERRMIERVLNLNQRTVSSIMTSRHDIEHIDLNAPEEEIRQLLERNQHTRLVVTDGDDAEDLLGVVHVIDLLQQSLRGEPLNLRVLIRQPLVFPETLPLLPALEQFRNARTHFAFVVDEFGSVEGIVTLSDVTETIAGNLPNEVEEIDARHDIQKNADGSWTANGHMPLEDLVQYVPLPLDEKREYHTIAGLLMEYLQRIPKPGEEVQVGDYLLKTLQVESHRVQKVQIIPLRKDGEMEYEV